MNHSLWNRAKAMGQRKGLKMRELIENLLSDWTNEQEKELADEVNGRD